MSDDLPGDNSSTNESYNNSVKAVRLPLPTIQEDNIELWFLQLDHWFNVNGIKNDNTKFSTTVAALSSKLLTQIFDIVSKPPEKEKFDAIKRALIKHFADSEQERIQKYVSGLQLGDRKPSHLLNDMRRVGIESANEQLLKGLWMQRLPVNVQTCLSTVDEPLAKLAELADKVMETIRTSNGTVSSVNSSDKDTAIQELRNEMRELARQVSRVMKSHDDTRRSRSRSATPNKRLSSDNATSQSDECWFHKTFGASAKKCRDPCSKSNTLQKN